MQLHFKAKEQINAKIIISDPDGNNAREYKFNSFIQNFVAYYVYLYDIISSTRCKQTNGSNTGLVALRQSLTSYYFHGGILLGTGSPARSATMYQMGSVLTTASLASTIPAYTITYNASTIDFTISKNFENISGADIDVTELAWSWSPADDTYAKTVMLTHDLIDPAYTLADGAIKKFSIKITLDNTMNRQSVGVFASNFTTAYYNIKDTGNTTRQIPDLYISSLDILSAAGVASYGIVVGTGSTANTIDDYKLETQIDNATLAHSNTALVGYVTDKDDVYIKLQRSFTNNTGGTITIKEVGVYLKVYATGNTSIYVMYYRKVLDTPLDIADGSTDIIEWVYQITFD